MQNLNIDIAALFKYSFGQFRKYASFVIGVMSTYFILGILPQSYAFFYAPPEPTVESQLFSFIAMLVQLFLALGFTKIMLYLIDDRPVHVKDMINNGSLFLDYVVAYFLFFLAVGIGLICFVLPGIYLALRLQFYPYYIIKHRTSSFEAIQRSWYATENGLLEIFLFSVCVLILNFLGALALGIGAIITYPITTMATAVVFTGLDEDDELIPAPRYQPD